MSCTAMRAHRRPSAPRCSGSARCWAMPWSRTRTGLLRAWPGVRIRGGCCGCCAKARWPRRWRRTRAPLLSRSGALAVQLLRDQLDLAVGSAVRSSGDAGLLIRWLSTDMGSADAGSRGAGTAGGTRGCAVSVVPGGHEPHGKGLPGLAPAAGQGSSRLRRRQNSLPSGSARTCHCSLPVCPTSAGRARGPASVPARVLVPVHRVDRSAVPGSFADTVQKQQERFLGH